jgi:uncharacterized protein (UPF0332 family)
LEEGWYNSAVSRAYYAMFQAAERLSQLRGSSVHSRKGEPHG